VFSFFSAEKKSKPPIAAPVAESGRCEIWFTTSNIGILLGMSRQAIDKLVAKQNLLHKKELIGGQNWTKVELQVVQYFLENEGAVWQKKINRLNLIEKKLAPLFQETDPAAAARKLKRIVAEFKRGDKA
jgi:hypothetical protein